MDRADYLSSLFWRLCEMIPVKQTDPQKYKPLFNN
jgi:hypothetical protein